MLRKILSLIFLGAVFFIDQLIAMEDPNLGSINASVSELDALTLILNVPNISQQLPNDVENSQISAIEEPVLEKESIEVEQIGKKRGKSFEDCSHACLLISFHSSHLTYFQECKSLKFTDKNLEKYQGLLHKLLHMGVNLRPIISAFNNGYFSWIGIRRNKGVYIPLKYINSFLSLLIYRINNDNVALEKIASKKKMDILGKMILYIGSDLVKILVNYNLLPPLDHKIFDNSLLGILIRLEINIDLLKSIINKERNKDYFKKLLRMRCLGLFDNALNSDHKIFAIILELMREKGVLNQDIIDGLHRRDSRLYKLTPLMIAACAGRYEILELLINYGADVNAINNNGETALSIAEDERKFHKESLFGQAEKIVKYDKCIALLRQAQINKADDFKY